MPIDKIDYTFIVPFKNFMPGQIIESKQFNDNMLDIQDIINDITKRYNDNFEYINNHIDNKENPHGVTCEQIGTYSTNQIDRFIIDLREGNLNEKSLSNPVFKDGCVDERVIADKSITLRKVSDFFGEMLDISKNMEILNRYTKPEIDKLLTERVGEGTYSKEEILALLAGLQAGQIVPQSVTFDKLASNIGELLDISKNSSISNLYTKEEIDGLVQGTGIIRDWGSITDDSDDYSDPVKPMSLPVANRMVAGTFTTPSSSVLNVEIKEVVDSRGEYERLPNRINTIEDTISSILNMFKEVNDND